MSEETKPRDPDDKTETVSMEEIRRVLYLAVTMTPGWEDGLDRAMESEYLISTEQFIELRERIYDFIEDHIKRHRQ